MTPEARLAAAANILDNFDYDRPVDPQLKAWARQNRYAGSGDRRAIADRVYNVLRRKRSSAIYGGGTTGRALVLGNLVSNDALSVDAITDLCKGPYGLEPPTENERTSLSVGSTHKSEPERLDWPEWLYPQAMAAFGDAVVHELDAMRGRAPIDLRVNSLSSTRPEAMALLAGEGVISEPVEISLSALRVASATRILNTEAYRSGIVELQDAASQAVADYAQPEPGQKILDFCAGAGGKTLALAALMANRGSIIAHDIDPRRMSDLPIRSERASVTIIRRAQKSDLVENSFDGVLVDAPCSGSGSWRRDPIGKWRLTQEKLDVLIKAQRDALSAAATYVRPGGTLTYATCSVFPLENDEQVSWFCAQNPVFELETSRALWPSRDKCDGFFMARFRRQN